MVLMDKCKLGDKMEFYRLVNRYRGRTHKIYAVNFGKHTVDKALDKEYQHHLKINYLLQSLVASNKTLPAVSLQTVAKYVSQFKQNKAPKVFGIAAEHIKLASSTIIDILTKPTNSILTTGKFPGEIKLGVVNPVPKPKKVKQRTRQP